MNRNEAQANYNRKVEVTLKQDFWNYESKEEVFDAIEKYGVYTDPDEAYEVSFSAYENIILQNESEKSNIVESITLSSDGLCGIKKIIQFSSSVKEAKENYKLIREGMFECLIWPAHVQSINICRGFKYPFDDRIDLALVDIQSFYEKIDNEKKLSVSLINSIKNDKRNCLLDRAYLNLMTFTWLCSFGNFNNFIVERNLEAFVNNTEGKLKAELWTETKKFDEEYFKKLISKTHKYRTKNIN